MPFEIINAPYREDPSEWLLLFDGLPKLAFLDSCQFGGATGRYHIITGAPQQWLTLQDLTLSLDNGNGCTKRPISSPDECWDAIAALETRTAIDLNLPFCGGLLGFVGYEFGAWSEIGAKPTNELDFPDVAVGDYRWALIQDNQARSATLFFLADCDPLLREKILQLHTKNIPFEDSISFKNNVLVQEINLNTYQNALARIQDYIEAGDCYQVNFTHRFSTSKASQSPLSIYRQLRQQQPGPMAAYLQIEPEKALLSFSPERLVKNDKGFALAQPIKGTAPRSANAEEDKRLALNLSQSVKDRAENLMIVDLLRNDLGRVCEAGSISVPKLFDLESFSNVHHLVSSIKGKLRADVSNIDLLKACFPGGSITGAPKRRAMEIIHETEASGRSAYCGSVFYSSANGQFDASITIRSLVATKGKLYCWGGGGITHDSDTASEFQESLSKIATLIGR